MLYWWSSFLSHLWGPLRLFSSQAVLMSLGTFFAGFLTWWLLPKFWKRLPTDRGKAVAGDGGKASRGKPTGAGLLVSLFLVPVIVLFVPLKGWEWGTVLFLYASMLFGFLDDASEKPWGQLRKGLLDAVVALGAAYCLYKGQGSEIWLPLFKGEFPIPPAVYVVGAAAVIWYTTNATNCSDGVDGLAGSLMLFALVSLAALMYVLGSSLRIANYLLIPYNEAGARWAVLAVVVSGAVAGYLWYNAEPSRVLMGDAGSRLLGMLLGVLALAAGNPFLIFVVAPVVLVNGGTGLVKLILLRFFKKLGFDTRPPESFGVGQPNPQYGFIKALHSVRFPLHDHCRKRKGWSNATVLMRFMLIQAALTPLLFILFVKLR
jgi:phospho-N-acetylmuramoyl-pentapeptide-transferase